MRPVDPQNLLDFSNTILTFRSLDRADLIFLIVAIVMRVIIAIIVLIVLGVILVLIQIIVPIVIIVTSSALEGPHGCCRPANPRPSPAGQHAGLFQVLRASGVSYRFGV